MNINLEKVKRHIGEGKIEFEISEEHIDWILENDIDPQKLFLVALNEIRRIEE